MSFTEELTFPDWDSLLLSCVPWADVREQTGQLRLHRHELSICVVEPPQRWRARHRRGLHRLGFRRFSLRGRCVWRWTLSLDELDAAARSHSLMNLPEPRTRLHERLARSFSREQLMREQLRRVFSDVLGFEPEQLCVELPEDEDDWDDPADDLAAARVS
ncbi:MAG: hypothetical protein QOE05_203 [Actinomycetota bacterium]|jgi:hypothetical protein|nr:hypothetical protein [Actinomycetota bacterium]